MAIKGAKSIAEYYIIKWLEEHEFILGYFDLEMDGNVGVVTDAFKNSIILEYNPNLKTVNKIPNK